MKWCRPEALAFLRRRYRVTVKIGVQAACFQSMITLDENFVGRESAVIRKTGHTRRWFLMCLRRVMGDGVTFFIAPPFPREKREEMCPGQRGLDVNFL